MLSWQASYTLGIEVSLNLSTIKQKKKSQFFFLKKPKKNRIFNGNITVNKWFFGRVFFKPVDNWLYFLIASVQFSHTQRCPHGKNPIWAGASIQITHPLWSDDEPVQKTPLNELIFLLIKKPIFSKKSRKFFLPLLKSIRYLLETLGSDNSAFFKILVFFL